ncbi:sugar 3,4-ketoisomerase [Phytopseudomonas dryadis]|uniref:dTDP-6-deoxy-3,4-keto-hexulose isomerase n=1 Tax=Phytopseudomonas dryadis TaxID=2487520 RepID=A0ABY1ZC60_9GAMM|nr:MULTISPECIES: FdtA/QdtA family cupin domain-containing protein [Pseudomonas]TBV08265.1 dTDP-6-deoxy-3,4-keto-hexulose isomerase [Pseudomonas dryadis]TBV19733.1 dTDP-6-deoxy-3,4-keto-hexulose isomerase [Pseudomonas sp. FRB 230]
MSLIQLVEFPILGDDRGSLIVMEGDKSISFGIKRVYYIFGTKDGVARGFHAHKELEQIAVCVSGQCRMVMDDGISKEEVWLDTPNKAIRIDKMIWHEMHDFSPNCVLLVLASDYYDEADYIRNYEDFLRVVA